MCGLINSIKNVVGFELGHGRDILRDVWHDPSRLLTGVDPLSTRLWNGVLGTDNQPLVNQLGGATEQRYADAEARGQDTGLARTLQGVAGTVAGFYGAQGIGNAFGGFGNLFGSGGGSAGAAANPYQGMGFYGFGSGGGEAAASGGMGGLGNLFGGAGGSSGLGSVGDLLRGGFGLYEANQLRQASQPSAINQQADAQLQALLSNPSSITSMPGYEAGIEAVQRGMAARGFLNSGNMATALQKYGGDFYNQAIQQYAGLSQLGRGGADANRMGSIQLAGQALNSLGYGALKLFGK
jgi:hypothetical protein